jgi:hypothetical protein
VSVVDGVEIVVESVVVVDVESLLHDATETAIAKTARNFLILILILLNNVRKGKLLVLKSK